MDLQTEKLEELASKLNLKHYDLLLIGDGAGTTIDKPCGFGCIAYRPDSKTIIVHSGGFSHGTNNFAELMPFLHALWYDSYIQPKSISFGTLREKRYVEIVSDSELTVKQGNSQYSKNANKCWWAAIEELERSGYVIHWNHVLRNTNNFNVICDRLAKEQKEKHGLAN